MNQGSRLREERERLGMSQTEFAAVAGASKHSQINWEKGTAFPNSAALGAWAKIGLDVLYVVTGQRSTPVADELPPDETILLSNYRAASSEGKAALKATSAAFAATKGKKQSVA